MVLVAVYSRKWIVPHKVAELVAIKNFLDNQVTNIRCLSLLSLHIFFLLWWRFIILNIKQHMRRSPPRPPLLSPHPVAMLPCSLPSAAPSIARSAAASARTTALPAGTAIAISICSNDNIKSWTSVMVPSRAAGLRWNATRGRRNTRDS